MDVEDNENRRLIFIIMKGILTPEEKQYLRRNLKLSSFFGNERRTYRN